jgi:hypothetical protein
MRLLISNRISSLLMDVGETLQHVVPWKRGHSGHICELIHIHDKIF